jgi:hypothetical protein
MHISPVTPLTTARPAVAPVRPASPRAVAVAAQQPAASTAQVTPQAVSAAVLQRAVGDGDGRTGAAALNDGDAAALAAAQQVRSSGKVDIKA